MNSTIARSFDRHTWLTGLLVWAGLALAGLAWAVSTPLGGSPDEPAHIIKAAAVAHGELLGGSTAVQNTTRVTVPADIASANSWPCFAFQSDAVAACQKPMNDSATPTSAKTSAGLYNPTYYAMVGWPSLLTSNAKLTVLSMRAVSVLLCTFFLAVAFVGVMRFPNRVVGGVAFLAAVTPMVLFLCSAVNPNGLEICTGAALLACLLVLVRAPRPVRTGPYLVLTLVSGAILANTRGLSPLWMAIIAVLALLAASPHRLAPLFRRVSTWLVLAGLAASVAAAGVWILQTNTLNSMGTYPGAGTTTPGEAFVTMLFRSFNPGLVGVFGWLDTFPPGAVTALWSTLAFGLVLVAFVVGRGRELWALVVAGVGVIVVPAVVQAASVEKSGYIWQGRYALVAYVAAILLAGVVVAGWTRRRGIGAGERLTGRIVALAAVLVVAGQLCALAYTIKRYAVGTSAEWDAFVLHSKWAPPGGTVLWLVVALVGLVIVCGTWGVLVRHEAPVALADEVDVAGQA